MIKTRYVILVITEACNLNCIYCFEHSKSNKSMDFSTAKKIIDYEFSNRNWDYYEIQLMGGEPLINFDLIKKLDYYIFETCKKNNARIFIVTNGTLMNQEKQKWFASRKHRVICGLSIDGIREAHNRSRSNSFDLIPIDFFHENWPQQDCRMTIHTSNIKDFSEGVKFLEEKGFTIQVAFAQGFNWVTPEIVKIFKCELHKLVDYYLLNTDKQVLDLLKVNFSVLAVPLKDKNQPFCGAGQELCSYNIDGQYYPCHTLTPISVGKNLDTFANMTVKDFEYQTDPYCKNCIFLACCSTCLGINLRDRGHAGLRDHSLCELHKARFCAASQITFIRKYADRKDKLSFEEFRELVGIARVQAACGANLVLPKKLHFSNYSL